MILQKLFTNDSFEMNQYFICLFIEALWNFLLEFASCASIFSYLLVIFLTSKELENNINVITTNFKFEIYLLIEYYFSGSTNIEKYILLCNFNVCLHLENMEKQFQLNSFINLTNKKLNLKDIKFIKISKECCLINHNERLHQ